MTLSPSPPSSSQKLLVGTGEVVKFLMFSQQHLLAFNESFHVTMDSVCKLHHLHLRMNCRVSDPSPAWWVWVRLTLGLVQRLPFNAHLLSLVTCAVLPRSALNRSNSTCHTPDKEYDDLSGKLLLGGKNIHDKWLAPPVQRILARWTLQHESLFENATVGHRKAQTRYKTLQPCQPLHTTFHLCRGGRRRCHL